MRRFTAKNVRSGLVTAWRLAGWPTRRSPSSVNATMDGVVRMPSAFSITFGDFPSITATHEFVVPRSIPMTFPMVSTLLFAAGWPGPDGARIQTPRYQMFAMTRDAAPHIGGGVWPARTGGSLAV